MEATRNKTEKQEYSETTKNILLSKAIEITKQAIDADEARSYDKAVELYQRSIHMLLDLIRDESNPARKEMFKQKILELLQRAEAIKSLQKSTPDPDPIIYQQGPQSPEDEVESDVILNINGVNCYSVIGNEKSLIATGTLQLLKLRDSDMHILKLDEFEFPLTKSIPCLCSSRGYFMVPMPGNIFYGFVFPSDIPDQYLQLFESKLSEICDLKVNQQEKQEERVPEQEDASAVVLQQNEQQVALPHKQDFAISAINKVASGVEVGSKYVIQGIDKGSQVIASGIEKGGEYIKSKVAPATTPVAVSPKIVATVKVASKVSPYCVTLSKALVKGLVSIAEEIGSAVADGIKETEWGKRVGGSGGTFNGPRTDAAKQLGKTSLTAIVNVWDALEDAGLKLLQQGATTTVSVVDKKYGEEAGKTTEEGFQVAVDMVQTAYNMKNIGVKKLAKRAVKETGKSYVTLMLEDKEETKLLEDQHPN